MKMILRLTVFAGFLFSCQSLFAQTTVTYTQQTGEYDLSVTTTGSGGIYNNGAAEIGMWMNGDNAPGFAGNAMWKTFRIGSATGNTARALQVGDEFTITVATKGFYYGTIGVSLNSGSLPAASWANRTTNSRIRIQQDGSNFGGGNPGSWYYAASGSGSFSITPTGSYVDYVIRVKLTSPDRCNVSVNGTWVYDVALGGTAGAAISHYSIYMSDDRAGIWSSPNRGDSFWKQTTQVQNTGTLNFGLSNNSFTESNILFNGLNANSTTTNSLSNTLSKDGTGNLTLNAANTYTGQTQINNGELWIGSSGSIASGSGIFVGNGGQLGNVTKLWLSNGSGGTTFSNNFTINNGNATTREVGGLNTSGTHTFSGNITNNSTTGGLLLSTINAGGAVNFSGMLSGGGAYTTQGAGTITFSGASANTYTGLTSVNAGTLVLNKNAGVIAIPTNTTLAAGATIRTNAANQWGTGTPPLVTINGNGILNLNNNNQRIALASASATASVSLGSATLEINNTGTDTYAGLISGTGAVTKTNTGVEILTNSSLSYSGATTITGGEIRLQPSANATFASQVVMNGGTLSTSGITATRTWTSTSTLNVSANSTIALASATAHTITFASSNAVSWTSGVTLTITGWSGAYNGTAGTGGRIFFGSSNTGLTAQQISQIAFNNGTNNFSAILLATGELVPSSNIIIPWTNTGAPTDWFTSTNWTPNTGSAAWTTSNIAQFNNAGTANTAGINMSTANLSIGGIEMTASRTRVLTIGNSTTTAGSLTLNGATLYGTANSILANNSSSMLTVQDNETGTGKVMNVILGNATDNIVNCIGSGGITIGSSIQGAGRNLSKSGTGTLTLSGTNTYGGSSTINAGTLTCGAVSTLPSSTALSIANVSGAALNVNSFNQTIASLSGGGVSGGNIALGSATLTINQNTNTSYAGIISGSGGITKSESGTLTLSGANSYSGSTIISGGTLQLGAAGVIADGSAITLGGGALSSGASAGFSETVGTLALIANSTIALGTGNHTITFANSSGISWTAATTLTITGWTGTAGTSGTAGKIFFGNASGTLTAAQLAQITFSGYTAGATLLGSGELVPVIPPVTYTWTGAAADGLWTSPSNWSPGTSTAGVGPTAIDNIIIANTASILNVTGTRTCNNFTVNASATYTMAASSILTINGNYTYNGSNPTFHCSSTLNIASSSSQSIPAHDYGNLNLTGGPRTLASSGTIGICGTYTPSGAMTVTGSTFNYNGTGAQTIFATAYNNLTISNNRGNAILTSPSGTISVVGTFDVSTLSNYTPSVNAASTFNFSSASAQNIPAFFYGQLNNSGNGNRTWASTGIIDIARGFSPGSGTHTITGSTVRYSNTSATSWTLSSFTTNIAGSLYNNLIFSGGASTTWSLNGLTVGVAGNLTLNAGTLLIGSSAGAGTLTVVGSFIQNGGTLNISNSTSNNGTFNLSGDFTLNDGSFTKTAGTSTGTVNFNSAAGIQQISQGIGTITLNTTVTINLGTGSTAQTIQFNSNLSVASGTLVAANAATIDFQNFVLSGTTNFIANSGTSLRTSNTSGFNTTGASGSVQVSGTRTFSNTGVSYSYNATSAQTTGSAIGSATSIANLTINNPAGVTLSSNVQSLTGTLTLSSGVVTLSNLDLNLASSASISGASASSYVSTNSSGQLKKAALTSAFTFPVGNSTYNPISITNTGTSDTYGVLVGDGAIPNATFSNAAVNRRWVITEATAGGGNLSVTAQYNTGETGATYTSSSQVYVGLYIPSSWATTTTTVNGTNPFTATGSGFNQSLPTSGTTAYFAIGNENMFVVAPSITTTTPISSVTINGASSGGSGISAGGGSITAKGVVWNTSTLPTTSNSSTNDGTGSASFSSSLSSLSAQTLYYVRAYATNAAGTAYANELTFRTLSNEPTAAATSFTATANGSAQIDLGWTAASFPGSGATANGYILLRRNDSSNPATTGVSDGVAPASLSLPSGTTLVTTITSGASTNFSNTGLVASTQYNYLIIPFTWDGSNAATYNYLLSAAPAANATTDAGFPSISITTAVSDITNNTAVSGGSSITSGGSSITSKGVAWNTSGTPTIADNITNDGSGTANFSSTLTGLSPQTLYYTRAYVTNNAGTAYANELSFRTLSEPATAQASGLTATVSGSNQLTLSWTAATFPSSGATQAGYALIYSEGTPALGSQNGTAPSAAIGTLVVVTPSTLPSTPATSTIVSGLTTGNLYNFRLIPFTWDGTNSTTYHYLTAGAPSTTGIAVSFASVNTVGISAISSNDASSGGSSINNGGGDISAKGIVWHTSAAPTLANNFTNDGIGTGDYSSSLTPLAPQTRYFVRAYATNELGAAYGNELNFYTFSNPPLTQASGLSASTASENSINLSWTAATFPGSGASTTGYVLLRATSPNTPSLASSNGAAPTAGANTTIVSASISGASTTAASTGLAALTTYNYLLVPFTWDGTNAGTYRYLTASAPTASATTFSALPAAQPSSLVFSAVTVSTVTTSWTAATGAPSGYIVLRSTGSAPNTDPVSGNTYTVGATLGNATVVFVGSAVTTGAQTGLIDGTTYFYEVFSYNGSGSNINYRTASPLSGSQATNPVSAPVATAATSVSSNSFTANWNAATSAVSYRLDVGTTPCFVSYGSSSAQTEGFSAGTAAPSGWTFTDIGDIYSTAGNFGLASPSLQMDATNDRVLTNQLSGSVATELSFWLKGNGTDATSALLVEGTTDGSTWTTIENITSSIPTTGTTKIYNESTSPSLPCSMIQFRFTYTKSTGNLAFDDVTITSASATPAFVSGYNNLTVIGTTQSVTGLNNNTAYYYRVRAVGNNSTSTNSNIITVTTLVDVSVADFRSAASGNWNAASTWEFNNGVTWVAATQAPGSSNNVSIQSTHTITLNVNHVVAAGKTITLNGTLNAGTNNLSGAGSFAMAATGILNTGGTSGLASTVQISNAANASFAAGATFRFSGTSANTGFSTFANLSSSSLYNIDWIGTTSLTLDKNVRLSTFNFTNAGIIFLGNFDLTIAATGTLSGAPFSVSKMVVTDGTGSLIRLVSAGTGIPFTWPLGDASGTNEYTPVTISNISGNSATNASIGFRVVDAIDPNMGLASNYVSRYWVYATSGLTAGTTWSNASFTYTAADIVGTQSLLKANAFNPGTLLWTEFASSSAASNVLTFTSGASTTSILNGNTITARQDPPIYYRSTASGDWTSLSTWQISTDPAFLSPTGVAAILTPTTTNSAGIEIANGTTVGISTAVTADDITISDGGVLSVTANGLTVANGSATTDLNINTGGTLQYSSSANNSLTINSGAAVVVNGLLKNNSAAGSPDVTNNGTITVASGGVYEHGRNAGTIPTCTWSSGSTCLITGTTFNAPNGLSQAFHHFTVNTTLGNHVNCTGALQTINGKFKLTTNHASFAWRMSSTSSYALTVNDSLIIRDGILDMANGSILVGGATINANGPVNMVGAGSILTKTGNSTAVVNANNNFTQNEGTIDFALASSNTTFNFYGDITLNGTVQRSSSGTHNINFYKASGQQDFSFGGTQGPGSITWNIGNGTTTNTVRLISSTWNLGSSTHQINVNSNATFNMQTGVISGNSTGFTVFSGSTLIIGHPQGITMSGTAEGNVQTNGLRDYSGAANYRYTGSSNQVTGAGLPTPITASLTMVNSGTPGNNTLTLTNSNTTVATFNLNSGLFAAGSGQQINISSGGSINLSAGDFASGATAGTVNFNGSGTWTGSGNPYVVSTSGGVNFGSGNISIQNGGAFIINAGGFVNTNAPSYASGSTLQYNVNGNYGRGLEWSATSGKGYPHHVLLSNNSTLNPANTGGVSANVPMRCGGNLTIASGSNIYMDFGGNNMTEDLLVLGNLNLSGNLSGSGSNGSDIFVGGNWNNNGTGNNFFPNSRAVFFNGTSNQNIGGSNAGSNPFPFLFIDNASGVTLTAPQTVSTQLTLTNGNVTLGAHSLTMGTGASISGVSSSRYIVTNATGQLIQRVSNSNVLFPVGPSSSIYAPVTLNQAGTAENIGVFCETAPPFDQTLVSDSRAVQLQWYLNESVADANNLFTSFQWPLSSEAASFNRSTAVFHGAWNGSAWDLRGSSSTTGSNPYTSASSANYTGSLNNRLFTVGNLRAYRNCNTTAQNGTWANASTWAFGLPESGDNVCIQHAVSVLSSDSDPAPLLGLDVQSGGSLSLASGKTLTVLSGGNLNNSSGSPKNLGAGTINANAALSITGAHPFTIGNLIINDATSLIQTPTISGSLQINANAYLTDASPVYSANASLIYNTGGSYTPGLEWNGNASTPGSGTPGGLTIQGNTAIQMPNAPLAVAGNIALNSGSLTLNSNVNNNLSLTGNWSRASAFTFSPNSRAVFFNGSNALQTIEVTGGGTETFSYLYNNKTAGDLQLASGTNVIVSASVGNVLGLINTSALDLNGQSLTLNGAGGSMLANGGTCNIIGGANSSLNIINATKSVTSQNSGTLSTGANVRIALSTGMDFGNNLSTINGTLQIAFGGFVSNNPPNYASGSTLRYFTGSTYGRGLEWSATSGPGYPWHVSIDQNGTVTSLDLSNGGSALRQIAGNLSINNGGVLTMQAMTDALNVLGNVSVANGGNLTLSTGIGGDLDIGGNFTLQASSTFNQNSREIEMNGNGNTQVLSGLTSPGFLAINNNGGSVQLSQAITIQNRLRLTNGTLNLNGFALNLAANSSIRRQSSTASLSAEPTVGSGNTYDLRYDASMTSGPEFLSNASAVRDLTVSGSGSTLSLAASRTVNRDINLLSGAGINVNGFTLLHSGNNASAPTGTIFVNGNSEISNSAGLNTGGFSVTSGLNQPTFFTKTVSNNAGTGTLNFASNLTLTIGDGRFDFGLSGGNPITTVSGVLQIAGGGSVFPNACIYATGSTLKFYNNFDYQVDAGDNTWRSGAINSGLPGIPWNVEIRDANTDLFLNQERSIRNNLTISDGKLRLIYSGSNTFNVGGNWTRTGTTSAFVNTSNKKVVFNRSIAGDQVISTGNGINTETFYDIEIASTGGGDVSIGNNVNLVVQNTMTLTSGKLKLGTGSTFQLGIPGNNGSILGAGANRYIVTWTGSNSIPLKLFTNTNGAYQFPVGDNTSYTPFTIDIVNGASSGSFITCSTTPTAHPSLGTTTNYLNRYWTLEQSGLGTGFTYNVNFSYTDADVVGSETLLFPFKWTPGSGTGTGWIGCGGSSASYTVGTGTTNINTNTMQWQGITSFSDFTGNGGGTPLPISLLSFEARPQEGKVMLDWVTLSETNNAYFTVERSSDLSEIHTVARIDGAGNYNGKRTYSAIDDDPLSGTSYYRLRQTDFSGEHTFSQWVAVQFINMANAQVLFYPNPVNTGLLFVETSGFAENDQIRIAFCDLSGKNLLVSNMQAGSASTRTSIDLSELQSGIYLMQMQYKGHIETRKIVVK